MSALFLSDLSWHDVSKLVKDRRTAGVADQLYRAVGKISSNICEGYSRGTGKDTLPPDNTAPITCHSSLNTFRPRSRFAASQSELHIPSVRTRLTKSRRRGFTLLETALTTVIIGTGVIALIELMAAGTMSNASATELSTAVQLANSTHEFALSLAFTNTANPTSTTFKDAGGPVNYTYLWDMNGDTYSPPLDVTRSPIATYFNWSQQVTINSVNPANVSSIWPQNNTTYPARVTVVIKHRGKLVYQTSWLIEPPNS